jgi:hypothetical protein
MVMVMVVMMMMMMIMNMICGVRCVVLTQQHNLRSVSRWYSD